MKAIIAAGGRSTRLRPITWTMNKHLIPLAGRPMIVHAIEKVKSAGITDIALNVNPGDREMETLLGDGKNLGVHLTYIEQEGGPRGIGHVPKNAEAFLAGGPFMFYLGDNIILGSLENMVRRFEAERFQCMIALSHVKDPQRFGVPYFRPDGTLEKVVEKPKDPPNSFAVTGIYLFDEQYFKGFEEQAPSARGEYEIPDMITWYIQNGQRVGYQEITGWWKDTGNADALLEGNALLLDEMSRENFQVLGEVDVQARLQGLVRVGAGTVVGPEVLIRGPVTIGENCRINRAYIGPYTEIGNGVVIEGAEIEHSIVLDRARLCTSERLVDSVVGHDSLIGSKNGSFPLAAHRLVVGDNSSVEL